MSESAKIKLKVGSIELEYEGDPSFLKEGLESLLVTMTDLAKVAPPEDLPDATPQAVPPNLAAPASNGGATYSTNTIAAHLEAKSGPDLVICAMAQLELVQNKTSSTRSDILAEMKSATTYFSESIRSNLSASLAGLTKGKRINQIAKDTYALSASERKQLEAKIADIG